MRMYVEAIRANPKVGRGSCTNVDECFSDAELAKALEEAGVTSVRGAVEWALDLAGLWLEQGLNQRWGEDDDVQLKMYREFHGK